MSQRSTLPVILTATAALVLFSLPAQAQIPMDPGDEFDDWKSISAVHDKDPVKEFRKEADAFEKGLLKLKERDFVALFGKPVPKPAKTFALPVAQSRCISLPGKRYLDPGKNKDHVEFYMAGEDAGIQVYYHIDGVSPAAIALYFKVDDTFPTLADDNLNQRLLWDRKGFDNLLKFFEKRNAEVFPWEVDTKEEQKLYEGDFSLDAKAKLDAWLASGKQLGYELDFQEEKPGFTSRHWTWYGKDGTVAREAYANAGKLPNYFIWRHKDGQGELRRETMGRYVTRTWRWCRAGTGVNIRYETSNTDDQRPDGWCWCDKTGKFIRKEWDDNGDGIPDWTAEERDAKEGQPLKLEESWAVHPDLIPEGSRIPDQLDRRVPIKRREVPKENAH